MAFFQAEKRPPCFLDKLPRGEKEQRMKSGKMDFGRKRSCFLSCARRGGGREGRCAFRDQSWRREEEYCRILPGSLVG